MQRAKLKSLYFAIIAALAVVAAYLAIDLPEHDSPTLHSFGDLASVFAEQVTVSTAGDAPR